MKITLNNLGSEDLAEQKFVKFKSKKHKLKGKQSVNQLVSQVENYSHPDAKFADTNVFWGHDLTPPIEEAIRKLCNQLP